MRLRLLGVLQDFGSPYASLYVNEAKDTLYIVVEQGYQDRHFIGIAVKVNCGVIRRYLDGGVSLHSIMTSAETAYTWKRKKGGDGTFTTISKSAVLSVNIDDAPFDPEFCKDIPLIKYQLDKIDCIA